MTATEPLLVRRPSGWGWGSWQGHDPQAETEWCCVIARALSRPVNHFAVEAAETRLCRRLLPRESDAIWHADWDEATDNDCRVILRLAFQMGVEP